MHLQHRWNHHDGSGRLLGWFLHDKNVSRKFRLRWTEVLELCKTTSSAHDDVHKWAQFFRVDTVFAEVPTASTCNSNKNDSPITFVHYTSLFCWWTSVYHRVQLQMALFQTGSRRSDSSVNLLLSALKQNMTISFCSLFFHILSYSWNHITRNHNIHHPPCQEMHFSHLFYFLFYFGSKLSQVTAHFLYPSFISC